MLDGDFELCSRCETVRYSLHLVCTGFAIDTQPMHRVNNDLKPLSLPGPDYRGVGVAVAVVGILALIGGLIWFLSKRNRLPWASFSSVRYEKGMNEDEIMLPSFHD